MCLKCHYESNVAVEMLELVLCVTCVSGSNPGPVPGCPI